jgi:hypothetical protein
MHHLADAQHNQLQENHNLVPVATARAEVAKIPTQANQGKIKHQEQQQ